MCFNSSDAHFTRHRASICGKHFAFVFAFATSVSSALIAPSASFASSHSSARRINPRAMLRAEISGASLADRAVSPEARAPRRAPVGAFLRFAPRAIASICGVATTTRWRTAFARENAQAGQNAIAFFELIVLNRREYEENSIRIGFSICQLSRGRGDITDRSRLVMSFNVAG